MEGRTEEQQETQERGEAEAKKSDLCLAVKTEEKDRDVGVPRQDLVLQGPIPRSGKGAKH